MELNELRAALNTRVSSLSDWEKKLAKNPRGVSFRDAKKYAETLGNELGNILTSNYAGVTLTYEDVNNVIKPLLLDCYSESVDAAAVVQEILNKRAGIGIKAVKPKVKNIDRIDNLTVRLLEDGIENAGFLLGSDVAENLLTAAVNETIKENADFQNEAGLGVRVRRVSVGNCCDWCESLAGTYDINNTPEGLWSFHKDCPCYIDYMPSKSKWTRISYKTTADGKLKKNTEDI